MWKPLRIHPKLLRGSSLADEVAIQMEKMGATDIKVLWSNEETLEAVVYVTPEFSGGFGRES